MEGCLHLNGRFVGRRGLRRAAETCEPMAAGPAMNSLFLSERPAPFLQVFLYQLIADGSKFAPYIFKTNLSNIRAFFKMKLKIAVGRSRECDIESNFQERDHERST